MVTYDFKMALLSAASTGYPPQIGTTLLSEGLTLTNLLCAGIQVLTLSGRPGTPIDVGLVYNPVPILSAFTSAQLSSFATARMSAYSLSVYGLNYMGSLSLLPGLTATKISVLGSTFMINNAYAGKTFAVIKYPMTNRYVAPFTLPALSALSAITLGATLTLSSHLISATTADAITPDWYRKHMLGYY